MRPVERRSPMAMPAPRLKADSCGECRVLDTRRAACNVQSKRHYEHRSRSRGGDEPLCHPSVIMRSYTDQPGKAQEQEEYSSSGDRGQSQHMARIALGHRLISPRTISIAHPKSNADSQVETQWRGNR